VEWTEGERTLVMKKTLLKDAVAHIFKTPFFKLILFIFLIVSVGLFAIQKQIIFPVFQKMQKASIESEAARTANHLRKVLGILKEPDATAFSADFERNLLETMENFNLAKIKIFNAPGLVVYSSEKKDIGDVNRHDYFIEEVAKGRIFSKIVEKNQTSLEGAPVPASVAEVYIPILTDGTFVGAFEIYYDITEQSKKIIRNEYLFKSASLATWILLTGIFVSLLIRASKANILKVRSEEELTKTNLWLERTVVEKTREIKATQIVSVQALATLAEHYDPDTGKHLERIQMYVRTLLDYLASSSSRYSDYVKRRPGYIAEIVFASVLHDIGKTAIPVEVLVKPAKLTPEEFEIVKDHTTIAGEALGQANRIFKEEFGKDSYLALARDIAMHHHEKWNGEGYPNQLHGSDIPLSARITAIADVYDALTSDRPYKKPWDHDSAVAEIVKGSGSHFEPELVEAFKQCGEEFRRIAESNAAVPRPKDGG
jgi:response regulator RpfG family c-di-GMP phosphodiesterase